MPLYPLDYRISLNAEIPSKILKKIVLIFILADPPDSNRIPHLKREKDRVCYTQDVVQVDLTQVKSEHVYKLLIIAGFHFNAPFKTEIESHFT